MPYCTPADVRRATDFPSTGAPISDDDLWQFILDAEEEIEDIYKTNFGNIEDSGTVTSATNNTLVDSTKDWSVARTENPITDWEGYVVWIYSGTGVGQYREILSNTGDTLTISQVWDTNPDGTSLYRITKLGFRDDTVDGSGSDTQFTVRAPLVSLNFLDIDDVEVTPSLVFQYKESGRLLLGDQGVEASWFNNASSQSINMRYIFGVYPIPRIIKRLCIILAAMRALTAQIAGTYDDFATVSLPGGVSASKGEPYLNIQASLNYMQGEARGIIYGSEATGQVSADFRTGPSYRPFTLFA